MQKPCKMHVIFGQYIAHISYSKGKQSNKLIAVTLHIQSLALSLARNKGRNKENKQPPLVLASSDIFNESFHLSNEFGALLLRYRSPDHSVGVEILEGMIICCLKYNERNLQWWFHRPHEIH
jgi:hypothetical protein